MLAIQTGYAELALEEVEAKQLSDAINRVWKHYPAKVTQKQLDIGMAIYAAGTIYGTRIAKIILDRRNAARENQSHGPAQVIYPFNNGPQAV